MASFTATPTAQGSAFVVSSTIVRSPVINTTGTPKLPASAALSSASLQRLPLTLTE